MAKGSGMGRSLAIGALLGVIVVAIVVAAVMFGLFDLILGPPESVESVLVTAVTKDVDDASVAGVVFVVDSAGVVEQVDSSQKVNIPGTTYDELRDAYAFGGGGAVESAYAEASGQEIGAWVALPTDVWIRLIDDAGGADVAMPRDANVFVDDVLYTFKKGSQVLSGAEVAAIMVAVSNPDWEFGDAFDPVVYQAISGAVVASWDEMIAAIGREEARSSVDSEKLKGFVQ